MIDVIYLFRGQPVINLTDDRCYLSFQRPASDKSDTDDRCYLSFQRPASDKSDR